MLWLLALCVGSPPRMRGKVRLLSARLNNLGITPAYAGKRRYFSPASFLAQDHPRVCGEKSRPLAGSRPSLRITPAYAGKRNFKAKQTAKTWDHPRVCGEKVLSLPYSAPDAGSPPRMRGKELVPLRMTFRPGITPAYAGKSYHSRYVVIIIRDHPRVCGEKARTLIMQDEPQGSPPRMRGKGISKQNKPPKHGITPAYAGKRLKRSHSIGHFSCILRLFHSVLHRASASGGSRAGPCAPPCLPAQNAVPV